MTDPVLVTPEPPEPPQPLSAAVEHLKALLHWDAAQEGEWIEAIAAAIGFAGPMALGVALRRPELGVAAATGVLLSAGGTSRSGRRPLWARLAVHLPAALAAVIAVSASGHGWLTAAIVTLAAVGAAQAGGFNRAMAIGTTRFIVYLVLALNVAGGTAHPSGLLLLIGLGIAWAAIARQLAVALAPKLPVKTDPDAKPPPTYAQLWRRWRGLVKTPRGWAYAARLGVCLGLAEAVAAAFPGHHLHWIALTVVLLVGRQPEAVPVKLTQRSVGTGLGVLLSGLLLLGRPPAWALVGAVGLAGGARSLLGGRSYLAYSAVMTPLIILLQDFTKPPSVEMLVERMGATLVGAAMVLVANRLAVKRGD